MKKSMLYVAATSLVVGSILASCETPAEKVIDAQSDVIKANEELEEANDDYLKEIESYRKESADKITANEKSISEFKARIDSEKKEAREEYKSKIAMLESKNSDMKKKMDDYKADGKDKWEMFKAEFSRDMDELGKAFKDLTTKDNH